MKHIISFLNDSHEESCRILWLTDLHLDAVTKEKRLEFISTLKVESPDLMLIGGDIANGSQSLIFLREIADITAVPIYFVLGNHDYYEETIADMRNQAVEQPGDITYLTTSGVIPLTEYTALVGHDGWSDGKSGDFLGSSVRLNDYLLINDLKYLDKRGLKLKLQQLGEEAAESLRVSLLGALADFKQVIILTHSPPFEEICLYEDKQTDENWAPHFVCRSIGDMLREVLPNYPDRQVILLCGHSHHQAESQVLPNLKAYVGHSNLGLLTIQGVISIE